ncbi:MAG TPA: hypothetical protein VIT45_00665 [Allosphingosinicella sp.]
MTEPEREEARTGWLRRTVTISHWSLLGLVLGTGAIVAIAGLAIAAVLMLILGDKELEAVLAIGVILAVMAAARLGLDLRRHLRIGARRRRMSRPEDDGDDEEDP